MCIDTKIKAVFLQRMATTSFPDPIPCPQNCTSTVEKEHPLMECLANHPIRHAQSLTMKQARTVLCWVFECCLPVETRSTFPSYAFLRFVSASLFVFYPACSVALSDAWNHVRESSLLFRPEEWERKSFWYKIRNDVGIWGLAEQYRQSFEKILQFNLEAKKNTHTQENLQMTQNRIWIDSTNRNGRRRPFRSLMEDGIWYFTIIWNEITARKSRAKRTNETCFVCYCNYRCWRSRAHSLTG